MLTDAHFGRCELNNLARFVSCSALRLAGYDGNLNPALRPPSKGPSIGGSNLAYK